MATTVGLVYSKTTWRLRSIVVPDNDTDLIQRSLNPGEALHIIPLATYTGQDVNGLQSILNGFTGQSPSNDRYINVDVGGNVVSVHVADPIGCGDIAPNGGTLIANNTGSIGDMYWRNTVIRPILASPGSFRLSAGAPLRGLAKSNQGAANQLTPQM